MPYVAAQHWVVYRNLDTVDRLATAIRAWFLYYSRDGRNTRYKLCAIAESVVSQWIFILHFSPLGQCPSPFVGLMVNPGLDTCEPYTPARLSTILDGQI